MRITEYVCDECGKRRSDDVNHWRMISSRFVKFGIDESSRSEHLEFHVYDHGFADFEEGTVEMIDVCGQDCAVKVFSRWLSTGKLKAEVPNGKSS